MSRQIRPFVAALILGASLQATASAEIIFNSITPGNHGTTSTALPQIGGEVTASGTSRVVTELDLGLSDDGIAATANLQAFLYANDAAGGAPGTLLWQSAVVPGVNVNSTNFTLPFAVPSIVVPSTFTFTGAITNGTDVFFSPSVGADTGTFVQAYVGRPGAWSTLPPTFQIEAQVIAVPEPATAAICGLGIIGLLVRKRTN